MPSEIKKNSLFLNFIFKSFLFVIFTLFFIVYTVNTPESFSEYAVYK